MKENEEKVEETKSVENQEVVKNETTEEKAENVEKVVEEEKKAEENFVKAEDFNWDEFETEVDSYSSKDRAKYEEIYDKTLSTINENEVIAKQKQLNLLIM